MRCRRSRLTRVRSAAAVPSRLKVNQSSWNLPCTEGTPNVDPGTLRQVSRKAGLIPVLLREHRCDDEAVDQAVDRADKVRRLDQVRAARRSVTGPRPRPRW